MSELIPSSWSDICLNYTGKSQDTARTDGETSLPWGIVSSHTHTHTNPCFCARSFTRRDESLMTCMSNSHGSGSEVLRLAYSQTKRVRDTAEVTDARIHSCTQIHTRTAALLSSRRRLSQRFDDLGSLTFIPADRTTHTDTHICHPFNA